MFKKNAQDHIQEYIDYVKPLLTINEKETIKKIFDTKVNAIQGIANTNGYKEIKAFFVGVLNESQFNLQKISTNRDEFEKTGQSEAIKMDLALRFLNFLDGLANYKPLETPKK